MDWTCVNKEDVRIIPMFLVNDGVILHNKECKGKS